MSRIYFTCIALLILSACKSLNESKYVLTQVGSISLPIDSLTKSVQIHHQEFGDTLIILDNKNNLLFYNLESQNLISKRYFPSEGEEGVPPITGFLYHNADSLFLLSSYHYKIFLIGKQGNILKKYNLQKEALPLGNFWALLVKTDKYLHIASYPYLKPEKKSFYQAKKIHLILDLSKDSCFYAPLSYPDIYKKYAYPYAFSFFYRTYNPKNKIFVYSFPADEYIQVVDKEIKTIKTYLASVNMSAPLRLSNFTDNQDEHLSKQKQSNSFYSIYYDSYRDIYYRFAQRKEKNNKTTLVVLVLDNNFNKIVEFDYVSLDDNFSPANALFPFVGKKGLYMPNFASNREDFFDMNIYQISQKD